MVGLWGIGFFSPELISPRWLILLRKLETGFGVWDLPSDFGSLMGMFTFTFAAAYVSRRFAFLCSFILCLISTIFVFNFLRTPTDAYWMLPLMGFSQLAVFAGYSIYFPTVPYPPAWYGSWILLQHCPPPAAPGPVIFGYLNLFCLLRATVNPSVWRQLDVSDLHPRHGCPHLGSETKDQPLPED